MTRPRRCPLLRHRRLVRGPSTGSEDAPGQPRRERICPRGLTVQPAANRGPAFEEPAASITQTALARHRAALAFAPPRTDHKVPRLTGSGPHDASHTLTMPQLLGHRTVAGTATARAQACRRMRCVAVARRPAWCRQGRLPDLDRYSCHPGTMIRLPYTYAPSDVHGQLCTPVLLKKRSPGPRQSWSRVWPGLHLGPVEKRSIANMIAERAPVDLRSRLHE